MTHRIEYSPMERFWLWVLSAFGFVGVNGAFMYGVFVRPEILAEARSNPLAMVFVLEALVLMAVLAYLLRKWDVTRLPWGWFVVLSLAGSLAFSLPVALLWNRREP
jgi:xanthine/uracil/vitamin C permease (AzgA family)